ncbi:MAG: mechanosensitive ion channel [Muribaculaceae bacterium]|nr:mechanosensitive ion channel [Muribaculaceae bacterium]
MEKVLTKLIKPMLIALLLIAAAAPAGAVLKERNLSKTLTVLCAELEVNYKKQKAVMASAERRAQTRHNELISLMKRSQQISLMLYSLPSDYVFDITYACEQAINLYDEFNRNMEDSETSFNYSQRLFEDVNRYDGLIRALECLPPSVNQPKSELEEMVLNEADSIAATNDSTAVKAPIKESIDELTKEIEQEQPYMLNEEEQKIREACIVYAKALRNNYVRLYNSMKADERHYEEVATRLTELNEYAQQQYDKLRRSLLEAGGDDYMTVLLSLPAQIERGKTKLQDKYSSLQARSDWRGPVIFFVSILIIVYMAIASVLSYLLIILLPKMPNRLGRYIRSKKIYQEKKMMISYALGVALFGVALGLVKFFVEDNHLVIMATSFMYIFAWLFFVIILSLTIRLNGEKMRHGLASYVPFLVMAFLVIIMRIVFMPNSLMSLIFPPIMLAATIWQIFNLRRHRKFLATSDLVFAYVSLVIMIFSTIMSWSGYALAGVESIVWWSFQLAFIQTIECIRDIAANYKKSGLLNKIRAKNHIPASTSDAQLLAQMKKGDYVGATWLNDLIRITLIPVLALFSFLASVVCEADFFNSANLCREYFEKNFIDVPDMIQISLYKLYIAGVMFFVFRYVLYVIRSGYRVAKEHHSKKQQHAQQANITLANNVLAILVWGFYFIFCLVLFNVPKSGISVISAGLATGLGFAMKDLLENFFYGISLMAGRVRVGDYIECHGTFGRVESITYQSTQISTLDGGTVAFLNKTLFADNFRNLTRTTNYAFVKLPIGVAYGSNIAHVRQVLLDRLNAFYAEYKSQHANQRRPAMNEKGFSVVFGDFGDSSVDLFVTYWVLVEQRIAFNAAVKEQIYNALNSAGIEIPFPQRDIHIIPTAADAPQA